MSQLKKDILTESDVTVLEIINNNGQLQYAAVAALIKSHRAQTELLNAQDTSEKELMEENKELRSLVRFVHALIPSDNKLWSDRLEQSLKEGII